jgi:hypothetical protein
MILSLLYESWVSIMAWDTWLVFVFNCKYFNASVESNCKWIVFNAL